MWTGIVTCTSKIAILSIVAILLVTLPSNRSFGQNCSQPNLEKVIASIQADQIQTTSQTVPLLKCGNQQSMDRMMFWNHYLSLRKGTSQVIPTILKSYRNNIKRKAKQKGPIFQARMGKTQPLLNIIDAGNENYSNSQTAHLVAARSLASIGQWTQAINYYDRFLRLARKSDEAEQEKLYILIATRRYSAAHSYIRKLNSFQNSPAMAESLERAKKALAVVGRGSSNKQAKEVLNPGDLEFKASQAEENTGTKRFIYHGGWHGEYVRVFVDHFQRSSSLDQSTQDASEFGVGAHFDSGLGVISGSLHYYSEGSSSTTGSLGYVLSGSEQASSYRVQLKGERAPLISKELSYDENLAATRDTYMLALDYNNFGLTIQLMQDGDEDPFEVYNFNYNLGLTAGPGPEDSSSVELGLNLSNRPKASPNYETFQKTTSIYAQYHWAKDVSGGNYIDFIGRYENLIVELWGDNKTESDQNLSLLLKLKRIYKQNLRYYLQGEYWARFNDDLPTDKKSVTTFSLGAVLTI